MLSVDEFIADVLGRDLKHMIADPETPAERHQRYLRERELKGRKTGSSTPAPVVRRPAVTKGPAKPVPKAPSVDPAKRRAATEARIKEMQARLEKLRELLRQLVEKAQERSGVDEADENQPSDSKTPSTRKKLSLKEREDAKKRAEEWRKKHPDEALDKQVRTLETQLENVTQKIAEMREKLAKPVSSPKGSPALTKSDRTPQPRR